MSFAVGQVAQLHWLVLPVDIAALAGLATVTFVALYGQSRVFYAMARDGFLPPAFARCTSASTRRFGARNHRVSPQRLMAAMFPLDILADLVSIGTLLAFIAVCVGSHDPAANCARCAARRSARPGSGSWRLRAFSAAG